MSAGHVNPKYRFASSPSFDISSNLDPRYASDATLRVSAEIRRAAGIVIVEHCDDEAGLRLVLSELGYEVRS